MPSAARATGANLSPALRRLARAVVAVVVACSTLIVVGTAPASAAINPDAGCTANAYPNNDDTGYDTDMGFGVYVNGTTTSTAHVSNNGYVQVGYSVWWVMGYDIDTRNTAPVTYGSITVDGRDAFCVNWVDVGYYSMGADKPSDAQFIIIDRSDRAPGDFDVISSLGEVLYDRSSIHVYHQSATTGYSAPGNYQDGAYTPGGPYENLIVTYTYEAGLHTSTRTNFDRPAATIALDGLTATYDGTAKTVTATVDPEAAGPATITYDGSPTAPTEAGSYTVVATVDTVDHYGTATGTLVIGAADQDLTVTPITDAAYGDDPLTIAAASDAGLAVTVTASGTCALTGDQLTYTAAGTCTLTLTQAGDANHNAASETVTFDVAKGDATVTVDGLNQSYDGTPRTVGVATTPADLTGITVTYDGSDIAPTEGGTYAVVVTLTNDNWAAAPIEATMVIGEADQTITVTAPTTATYGDGPVTYTATASSGLAVTSTVTGPCTLTDDSLSIDGAGTCTITSDQAGNDNYAPAPSVVHVLTIAKAAQDITVTGTTALTFPGAPGTVTTTSSANLPVTVTVAGPCTYDNGTLTATGTGTCTVTAIHAGNANYGSASATMTVEVTAGAVTKTAQTITVDVPGTVAYNAGPIPATGSASSGLALTWTATGSCDLDGTDIVITDVGTCTFTASQDGDASYSAATPVTRTIEVTPGQATITMKNLTQTEGTVTGVEVVTNPPGVDVDVTVTYYLIDPVTGLWDPAAGTTTVPTAPSTYHVIASVDDDRWDIDDVSATFEVAAAAATPEVPTGPQASPDTQTPPARLAPQTAGTLPETGTGVVLPAGVGVLLAAAGVALRRAGQRAAGRSAA